MNSLRISFAVLVAVVVSRVAGAETTVENAVAGSRENLRLLAGAIKAHVLLHDGKRPEKLSVLLEEALIDGAGTFVIPGRAVPTRAEIDAKTDYTLESLPGVADLLVREKLASHTPGKVLAIFKDGTIKELDAPGRETTPTPSTTPSTRTSTATATRPPPAEKPSAPSTIRTGGQTTPVLDNPPPSIAPSPAGSPQLTEFKFVDTRKDRVGPWAAGASSGLVDGHFIMDLAFPAETEISAISIFGIHVEGGANGLHWDTRNSRWWLIGVERNGASLNHTHGPSLGSFNGPVRLDLFVEDANAFRVGSRFTLEVILGSGEKLTRNCEVMPQQAVATTTPNIGNPPLIPAPPSSPTGGGNPTAWFQIGQAIGTAIAKPRIPANHPIQANQNGVALQIAAPPAPGQAFYVGFSGMPLNNQAWLTVALAGTPDSHYGEWYLTRGLRDGLQLFRGIPAGRYEARGYQGPVCLVRLTFDIAPR